MEKRPFRNYSYGILKWWIDHIDSDGCDMCPTQTPPEIEAQVRAEFARRVPDPKFKRNGKK